MYECSITFVHYRLYILLLVKYMFVFFFLFLFVFASFRGELKISNEIVATRLCTVGAWRTIMTSAVHWLWVSLD